MFLLNFKFYAKALEKLRVPTWRNILYFLLDENKQLIQKLKIKYVKFYLFFLLHVYINYNTCYEFIHVTKSE